jgi:hypothetical protein
MRTRIRDAGSVPRCARMIVPLIKGIAVPAPFLGDSRFTLCSTNCLDDPHTFLTSGKTAVYCTIAPRTAEYVDGNLPVEQPTKFDLGPRRIELDREEPKRSSRSYIQVALFAYAYLCKIYRLRAANAPLLLWFQWCRLRFAGSSNLG